MKIIFWLLDINDEVGEEGPEIRLWGLDDKSRRLLIVDRSLTPYLYLLLEGNVDAKEVAQEIKNNLLSSMEVVGIVDKKYFGKPVKAVKVIHRDTSISREDIASLVKIRGVKMSLEGDIRYSSRYLIDNEVIPCSWHEIEVEKLENRPFEIDVDDVYIAKNRPKTVERLEVPLLRVLSFSMVCFSKRGSPTPDKSPIIIISVTTNKGKSKQFVTENNDDKPVVEAFTKFVKAFNPDIIAGYGSNTFEWPYIQEKMQRLGINLQVDRERSEPHKSVYGHISIIGRVNIDLHELIDEIPEVKVKTLENLAEYLGVANKNEWTRIEDVDIPQYWENRSKRFSLIEYSSVKTSIIQKVANSLLDFAMQLSSQVGLPLDHVATAGVGFRTESYLLRQAHIIGELIPPRVRRPYIPYKGGFVLEPKPGLHEKTAVLDFKSMYPNIMISKNISPDTYIGSKEREPLIGVYVAPEVKYRFIKTPPGFYSRVLTKLILIRNKIRDEQRKLDPEGTEYKILDARQQAIKIITNATYGYAGWVGARWYVRQVAEAAAAWGRYVISYTINAAKRKNLEVIYGDTDSLFVEFDDEKIKSLMKTIREELDLEIILDEVYERILFTDAKKRYAGLLTNGKLDVVGLEAVRGDWCEAAKKVQEGILEIILKEKSPEKAKFFVEKYIADLRKGNIPYRDLILWKTLTKKPTKYAVKTPHVEAAKLLLKEGWKLTIGDKIGFVIISGIGKLYERAIPYFLTSYDELDLKYYEQQQILPVALRILSIFNVNKEKLN